ncbi:SAM-dependent methyltransferase [Mycobacterium sp. Y57]|uniref:SAM-dependent methyltransferase n=1 Tax=Mycolicibacterium xanthum TaxID=2796469 RepID=UPI001C8416C8|nr:SAM-dependent methyltransferase [Mycolicibacterium xanthum]MBX7434192.1 SAM-dependent methyltransferase [Mycolicibacterium xanthum]
MRTGDDSWDITTSVGWTALFVAAARALEAHKPAPLAVDPYAELFCRAVGGTWSAVLDGTDPENLLATRFGDYCASFQGARTRFFDDYFAAAADAGVRQVVIVAAGLDSRAYRLSWPDTTVVYELDREPVLAFKRDVLNRHGATPTADRREVAVDLRRDWPSALQSHGFDPGRASAWLAEGLMMYLPATAQEALLDGIDSLAAQGSHAAIEDAVPFDDEYFAARLRDEIAAGDAAVPLFQLIYNERCAPADEWFAARGWTANATSLIEYLSAVGRPIDPADPEASPMIGTVTMVTAARTH